MTWAWYSATPDGDITAELTTARDKKVTWRLDAAGEAEFGLHGNPDPNGGPLDQTGLISPLATDLIVTWNGSSTFGWRGRCGPNQWALTDTTYAEKWSAVDYRGMLARRYVRSAQSFTADPTAEIARDLVLHAQTGTAGSMGVGIGDITDSPSIDLNVAVGKSIGEQIDELAVIYPGWDWWVDADMQFQTADRGAQRDFPLEYPSTCSAVSGAFDPAVYGNTIVATGADGLVPAIEYAPDLTDRTEGRWELVTSNPDVSTQAALNASTDQTLLRAAASGMSHTFTLRPGWTPDLLWVGDIVTCRYQTGTRSMDFLDRVYEIAVTDDGNGTTTAQVSVGNRLTADLAAMNKRIVMRLNQLARR